MQSCKQISVLVSESLDRKLSLREQLSMKLHLKMCKACQQMARQMALLRATSRHVGSAENDESKKNQEHLSKTASNRILKRLRDLEDNHK